MNYQSRTLYETKEDLANEKTAFVDIKKHFKVTGNKLPKQYRLDFILYNKGSVWAVVEYKCRRGIKTDTYPDIILSCAKFMEGKRWVRDFRCKFYFVVEFSDGLYCVELTYLDTGYAVVTRGGRTDRDDWQDIEPVIRIPIDNFKRLLRWENA